MRIEHVAMYVNDLEAAKDSVQKLLHRVPRHESGAILITIQIDLIDFDSNFAYLLIKYVE